MILDKPPELVLFGPPPWHCERGARRACHACEQNRRARRRSLRTSPLQSARDAGRRAAAGDATTEAALAAFAHDIRTSLTGILALGELLASSNLGERERRWAAGIKTSAEHLAALTTLAIDARRPRPMPAR